MSHSLNLPRACNPISRYSFAGLSLALLLISGCMAKESEMLGAPVEGYNHTSAAINRFTVNGAGGPNLGPYGGGGRTGLLWLSAALLAAWTQSHCGVGKRSKPSTSYTA